MAKALPLPDGTTVAIREGETPAQTWERAQRMYPEAFGLEKEEADKPKQDTSGGKAAFSAGLTRLGGQAELLKGKLGIKSEAEAQKEYEAAEKKASERFTPTEKSFTEDPFLKFRELLGGSVPYMLAPVAAGATALALPAAAPAAAIGLGLAGLTSAGQFTGSNLARQVDTGKSLEEASLGKAVAAAVPQALIDTAAMALLPGVGKLFSSVGSKLTAEQARAIANQTLSKAAMDYTAKTGMAMGREGLTEVAQQSLERLQAGLAIADPDARKEYIDSFIGGAVLGGTLAPVGRAIERSGAKSQAAKADRDDRNAAAKEAAEQTRIAEEAEAARKNTPEYAVEVGQQYDTLLQEFQAKQAQLKKPGKNATPVEKAEYADAQKEVQALNGQLKELVPEYRRTESIRAQEAKQFALTPSPTETATPTEAVEVDPVQLLERKRQAQQLLDQNQQELSDLVASGDVTQFDSTMKLRRGLQSEITQLDSQLKQAGVADVQTDPVALQAQLAKEYTKLKDMAGEGFDPDKAERQRAKIGKLETQLQTVAGGQQGLDLGAPVPLELPLTAAQKQRDVMAQRGTAAGQQRIASVEEEEQAALDAQREQERRDAEQAQLAPGVGSEIMALRRIAANPTGEVSDEDVLSTKVDRLVELLLSSNQAPAPAGRMVAGTANTSADKADVLRAQLAYAKATENTQRVADLKKQLADLSEPDTDRAAGDLEFGQAAKEAGVEGRLSKDAMQANRVTRLSNTQLSAYDRLADFVQRVREGGSEVSDARKQTLRNATEKLKDTTVGLALNEIDARRAQAGVAEMSTAEKTKVAGQLSQTINELIERGAGIFQKPVERKAQMRGTQIVMGAGEAEQQPVGRRVFNNYKAAANALREQMRSDIDLLGGFAPAEVATPRPERKAQRVVPLLKPQRPGLSDRSTEQQFEDALRRATSDEDRDLLTELQTKFKNLSPLAQEDALDQVRNVELRVPAKAEGRLKEELADLRSAGVSDTGQAELFAGESEKASTRTTPQRFLAFLDSKKVQGLRAKLAEENRVLAFQEKRAATIAKKSGRRSCKNRSYRTENLGKQRSYTCAKSQSCA